MPAIPLASPKPKAPAASNGLAKPSQPAAAPSMPSQPPPQQRQSAANALSDAKAAVAEAMAKLPQPGQKKAHDAAINELSKKVAEVKVNEPVRGGRGGQRGTRGGARGGREGGSNKKMEVPTTDYDFATANAKFNKEDLIKEAIATGSPISTPNEEIGSPAADGLNGRKASDADVKIPPPSSGYNKSSSFFDNISSDNKDREAGNSAGGREWRGEEQKKNLETFGQGSVDGGYRGGFRGRGRGRGRGYPRGGTGAYRGQSRGRGSYRGGRGESVAASN